MRISLVVRVFRDWFVIEHSINDLALSVSLTRLPLLHVVLVGLGLSAAKQVDIIIVNRSTWFLLVLELPLSGQVIVYAYVASSRH